MSTGIDVVARRREALRYVGYAAQDVAIYPARRVKDNLLHFGRLGGLRGADLTRRVDELTELLALGPLRDRYSSRLSGGEKRRLHVAIALLADAPLVILDEPTANSDVETRRALLDVVRSLADRGRAFLYASHYLPEIEELDARVVMIDRGRVIASGSVRELVARHGYARVEATFSRPPLVEIRAPGAAATVDGTTLRVVVANDPVLIRDVIRQISESDDGVETIDVVKPRLESVYLALRS